MWVKNSSNCFARLRDTLRERFLLAPPSQEERAQMSEKVVLPKFNVLGLRPHWMILALGGGGGLVVAQGAVSGVFAGRPHPAPAATAAPAPAPAAVPTAPAPSSAAAEPSRRGLPPPTAVLPAARPTAPPVAAAMEAPIAAPPRRFRHVRHGVGRSGKGLAQAPAAGK